MVDTIRKTRTKKYLVAVKLDMSKAFDRIEWNFLIAILRKLGFHEDWCTMIYECIYTISYFVFLNGSPSKVFYPTRGLRHGDPLSPYLFIICMDWFFRMLLKVEQDNSLHSIKVTRTGPSVSLFFLQMTA